MESIPLVTPVKGSYLYSLINEILASEKPNIVMQSNQLTTLKYMLRVDCAMTMKISSISRLKRIFFWRPMFSGRRDDMSRLL